MPADEAIRPRAIQTPSRRPWHPRRRWAGAVLALLVALGACSSGPSSNDGAKRGGTARAMPDEDGAGLRAPGRPATLSNLTRLDQLEKLFDAHQDVPRLILLLSPT